MSLANFQNLASPVRSQLRALAESVPITGRTYLLNARHAKLGTGVGCAGRSPTRREARQYFTRYQLGGYRQLEPRELLAMEPPPTRFAPSCGRPGDAAGAQARARLVGAGCAPSW